MQAISHSIGTFAPIRAANKQAFTPKPAAEPVQVQTLKPEAAKTSGMWEGRSFSFWDILDAINPLQHIPVISTIYRKISGDDMGYAARIAGDTLYSGLFGSLISGLVSAIANVFVDSTTGKDIGEHVLASVAPSATPAPAKTRDQTVVHTIAAVPSSPDAIAITTQQATILAPIDPSKMQLGIDQYKWQMMADEVKTRSNYWG